MIALTSISPKHLNNGIQKVAVESWLKLGMKVVSMNSQKEIEILEKEYKGVDIEFVPSHRTMEVLFGRPLITINALLDYAKDQVDDEFMIINSDIIIKDVFSMYAGIRERMPNAVTMVKRRDFDKDINNNTVFESGIDIFFIHRNFLHIFPQSIYCIGECWWDYWIPYTLLKNNVTVHKLNEPFAFHKTHAIQYDMYKWGWIAEYFKWENNLKSKGGASQLNQYVYNYIHQHLT